MWRLPQTGTLSFLRFNLVPLLLPAQFSSFSNVTDAISEHEGPVYKYDQTHSAMSWKTTNLMCTTDRDGTVA